MNILHLVFRPHLADLNRKFLDVALLRLRFCSIGSTKSDLNPSAILLKLFLLDALPDDSIAGLILP
ncbi:MAG: hypothetical protein KJ675_05305, partial [Gammaproteobacteria bacterium]|nr:hypothetical protein [Gammaproteobacteria bacterium]